MKIFFICSLSGKEKYIKNYEAIIKHLEKNGHQVVSDHVFKRNVEDVAKFNTKKHQNEFGRLFSEMRKCDVVIAEVSFSSTTIGSFIALALQNFIPTLLLHQNSYHGLVVGDPNRLMQISNYSLGKIGRVIDNFLEFAERRKLSIRFNLMIDKDIDIFLTQKSLEINVSKAEYVRRLIQSNIKK